MNDLDKLHAAAISEADAQTVDNYVRKTFHTERVEDRSGLFGGNVTATAGEPTQDEQFAQFMRRHFP